MLKLEVQQAGDISSSSSLGRMKWEQMGWSFLTRASARRSESETGATSVSSVLVSFCRSSVTKKKQEEFDHSTAQKEAYLKKDVNLKMNTKDRVHVLPVSRWFTVQ